MKHLIDKLVNIARGEIGIREEGGNNLGKRVKEYQQSTWLTPDDWPWCAAFTAWVLRQWLQDSEVRHTLNLSSVAETGAWRCRDASAFGWVKWANNRKIYVTDEKELAKKGDFVVFDFSHIGIVAEDQAAGAKTIVCIEGNTNGRGDRDSTSGDGVWLKTRNVNLVRAYIRIFK